MSLSDKSVVVVTGAANGIGRQLAIEIARENVAGIAVSDINQAGLDETAEMAVAQGVEVLTSSVDVAKLDQIERFARETIERFGRVTHLINNAGVGLVGRTEEISFEDIEWLMGINFWGIIYGTKTFLPIFRKQNFGHITNISSVFGLIGAPGQSAYCASKFAVRGFTESLRLELEGTNIFVSCVHPGGIKTDIAKNARRGEKASDEDMELASVMLHKLARSTANQAAKTIIKGIKAKHPRILIGPDASQISAIQRLFPKRYFNILDRLTGGMLSKYR